MVAVGICEDDAAVRSVLPAALKLNGYHVVIARNGHEAVENFATSSEIELLILDIGLRDADGRDVCQALRAAGRHAPVLFLTALDRVHDRVSGFHAGGDDYLVKPFAIVEVLARLESLIRRSSPRHESSSGLQLDPKCFSLKVGEVSERLTPTEFGLLAALAAQPGVVVLRRKAIAAGWPDGAIVSENTIDAYIHRIRARLKAAGSPHEADDRPRRRAHPRMNIRPHGLRARLVWATAIMSTMAMAVVITMMIVLVMGFTNGRVTAAADYRFDTGVATLSQDSSDQISLLKTPSDVIEDMVWLFDTAGRQVEGPAAGSKVHDVVLSLSAVTDKITVQRGDYRYVAGPLKNINTGKNFAIVVAAASSEPYEKRYTEIFIGLGLLGLFVIAGTTALAAWIVGRTLKPVNAMSRRAQL